MKLKSIIVEDEETSRKILRNYLTKYCPNVSIMGEASNVEEALVILLVDKQQDACQQHLSTKVQVWST